MLISKMAHNEAVCRQAENAINALIDMVKAEGGMCWIQSRENKEHYYKLTDHISICCFAPAVKIEMEE